MSDRTFVITITICRTDQEHRAEFLVHRVLQIFELRDENGRSPIVRHVAYHELSANDIRHHKSTRHRSTAECRYHAEASMISAMSVCALIFAREESAESAREQSRRYVNIHLTRGNALWRYVYIIIAMYKVL